MPDTPRSSSPSPDLSERAWTERTGVVALDDGHEPWEALARLARVHGPHLAPLVRVSPVPDGSALALTHLVPVGAVALAELREDSPLRAGHVVTVALGVADALAALHDAGLAHGGVDADAVLVAPDGGVVLAGAGLAWRPAPGAPGGPTPSDDVDAVGELVRDLLGAGGGASGLVIASLRASDPDPAARPTASALRDLVRLAAPAAPLLELLWTPSPVRIDPRTPPPPAQPVAVPPAPTTATVATGDDPVPLRTPQRRDLPVRAGRRPSRWRTAGRGPASRGPAGRGRVVAVVALACAGLALVAVARSGTGRAEVSDGGPREGAAAPPSSSVVPTAVTAGSVTAAASGEPGAGLDLDRGAGANDWARVLGELDAARTRALERGSLDELARVVDRRGTAWAADAALARRVSTARATVRGGSLVVTDVRVASVAATTAVLVLRDRRTAYTVTVDGSTQHVPERQARWWQVRLVRDGDRWLIDDVEALDAKDVTWTSVAVSTRRGP